MPAEVTEVRKPVGVGGAWLIKVVLLLVIVTLLGFETVWVIPESVLVVEGAVCLSGEEVSSSSDMVSEALGFLRLDDVSGTSLITASGSEIMFPVGMSSNELVSVSDMSLVGQELRSEVTESSRQPRGLIHGLWEQQPV